jgi:hypothetical protein
MTIHRSYAERNILGLFGGTSFTESRQLARLFLSAGEKACGAWRQTLTRLSKVRQGNPDSTDRISPELRIRIATIEHYEVSGSNKNWTFSTR